MFADGEVISHRRRIEGIRLRLERGSADVLELLKDAVGSAAPIEPIVSNGKAQLQLVIYSRGLGEDLHRHGIRPNRAKKNIPPPMFSDSLEVEFWHGMVDGDGCLQRDRRVNFFLSGWTISLCGHLATVEAFRAFARLVAGYRWCARTRRCWQYCAPHAFRRADRSSYRERVLD